MRKLLYFLVFTFFFSASAQQPKKLNSAEIFNQIQKLNFLGSVLYIAAHPDDENTRLISYFSNKVDARTAYLSLTRGDGGQNLIGPELRELLGVIRTQELLAARRIDGGEQFFSRANDFGYSKHPDETLQIWDKEKVLSDVVWTLRKFRPDVIINRFNHESAGETHGHHTSSALLSLEAFELAGKASAFPQQLENVEPWQPKRIFFNTSPWFYGSQEAFEQADKSDFLQVDVGVFYPMKGLSNTEIASLSRSQHQSQGFGSTGTRGREIEYLQPLMGGQTEDFEGIFQGIDTSWGRIEGGDAIGEILYEVEKEFDFRNPAASVPALLKAYELIRELEDAHWKRVKTKEIKNIIAACSGLFLEAVAKFPIATPGEEIPLKLEAINRSSNEIQLISAKVKPNNTRFSFETPLKNNLDWQEEILLKIPEDTDFSTPYWLREEGTLGMYTVNDQDLIGLAESPREFRVAFLMDFGGVQIPFIRPVVFKENDPVEGEIYRPFEIVPKISASLEDKVIVFADEEPKRIQVRVKSHTDSLEGRLELGLPNSWKVSPESYNFSMEEKGEEKTFFFSITPPAGQEETALRPLVRLGDQVYSKEVILLDYDHIPAQALVLPSEAKLVKLNIQKEGELIGYIRGAGDVVPRALEQMGYEVVFLDPERISAGNMKDFDAVVLGIRAFNTVDALRYKQEELFEYVKQGGNLIVQYNTTRGLVTENIAPYHLELSSNRVTNEEAAVAFLAENHPILNTPNKITEKDFEGWVQERGLYFPDEWAPEFTPILSIKDRGESGKKGSLLVASYGKGNYIYTGLSFFREFPAGVPGAFRLFANLVSLDSGKGQGGMNVESKLLDATRTKD